MSNEKKLFFKGGIPAKPDVDRLVAKFGTPAEGDVIAYADIAQTIQEPIRSNRYCTVVESWRKRMFRMNSLFLIPTGDGSFKAANSEEKVKWATDRIATAGRVVRKAVIVSKTADPEQLCEATRKKQLEIAATWNQGKLSLAAKVFG